MLFSNSVTKKQRNLAGHKCQSLIYHWFSCRYLVSIGVENGEILLYSWKPSDNQGDWTLITKLDQQYPLIEQN